MDNLIYQWENPPSAERRSYICGYCGNRVGPDRCYKARVHPVNTHAFIYICPTCTKPTFFDLEGNQYPSVRLGTSVDGITDANVEHLYNEARDCSGAGAYTACVLLCRKILMNIAVQHGAKEGERFIEYVDYLEKNHFVPPNGKEWVDKIRQKGNEATHEIALMSHADASQILKFVEMLLRFVYEFPSMVEP